MKVIFIGNSCEHVVRPLCDGLYEEYGDNFTFIQTKSLNASRAGIGSETERSYIFSAIGREEYAKELCTNADVVIFGGVSTYFIEERIKNNKLTIYYSERLFKKGYWRYFNPITIKHVRERFVKPSKNSNFHLLCASSFASLDFKRVGAFKGKAYKYGYQIEVYEKNLEELIAKKPADGLSIIWVGRLVKLKNCDHAIKVVKKLVDAGYNAKMTVIGGGVEEDNLKSLVADLKLENNVIFKGTCKIEETRRAMDEANIFLFTSSMGEGWGATLNECMNSACACVASDVAGSTYFLTKDGEDALIYKSGNVDMLYQQTLKLVKDKKLREKISRNAYNKIYTLWNPKFSSKRVVKLIECLKNNGDCNEFSDGPCSKAEVITHRWYKG